MPEKRPAPASGAKAAARVFAREPKFLLSAPSTDTIPHFDLPEVAFAGRSNVGKSSLINALFGRRNIARTSSTPGRTQMLNFFLLDERIVFVDMPGYGYAKVPKAMSVQWGDLIGAYLYNRKQLKRVYLLADSRHGLKDSDLQVMQMLDEGAVSYQLVLTKADKLSASEIDKALKNVKEQVEGCVALHPEILVTSASKKRGIDTLQMAILALV